MACDLEKEDVVLDNINNGSLIASRKCWHMESCYQSLQGYSCSSSFQVHSYSRLRMEGKNKNQPAHLALDIGGILIKMVYFSSNDNCLSESQVKRSWRKANEISDGFEKYHIGKGRLRFVKFETRKINDCLEFISSNQLCTHGDSPDEKQHSAGDRNLIKTTGGGEFKFADLCMERLDIILDKVEGMDCLVAGANYSLKANNQEAFTYMNGHEEYLHIDHNDMYPYLLVNVGSGVEGDEKFERVSGTSGGGTFWGIGKLLTTCKSFSFDELLKLSQEGNNRVSDMLVGDIYGVLDYSKIGLSSATIASSFGKAISENKELEDYRPEDMARSLLCMFSKNIGQIS
ncbi:Pantothenate kinase 2 [Heracleum sosnowskyi]|uniref:Pantothenate kinase 2 n=1 Tax=Heracleum sosnowskyi TaxID=360622 RepID=A0AAD8H1K8_9APIA|nr:Pantothenate kinase 2 [Heracleum sosnowskyi]